MIETFGSLPDGREVHRVTLARGDLTARFLTYGAVLQDLRLAGHPTSLTLGLETLADYLSHSRFFGATAGRCANRIGNARFTLDGQRYDIDKNFKERHHLHGGSNSLGKRLWTVADHGPAYLAMTHTLPDGHMGYPGTLQVQVRFTLDTDALDIRMTATTDAPTLCNLAHHSYWVLDDSGTILDHNLQIPADRFTAVDNDLIPTDITPVAGTRFDFRTNRPIRDGSEQGLIDHNFCFSPAHGGLQDRAILTSPRSGLSLSVRSTEPGLQVYDSAPMDVPVLDIDGRDLKAYAGLALEPQIWPDAINNPDWPSPVLRPGETYDQHTRFEIERA